MRVAIYARVSTSDKGQNPKVQVDELRRFCGAREWHLVETVVDQGYSGGTDQRPGLKNIMALARSRQIDVVLVTKLDRMARSLKHLVALLDEFKSLGVSFVSLGDQIDLSTASGRLMLHIVAAFAEFERSLIRERTLAGLAFARSQGKTLGRPLTSDYEAIRALKSKGFSQNAICNQLGVSKGAIWRALRCPEIPPNRRVKKPSEFGSR